MKAFRWPLGLVSLVLLGLAIFAFMRPRQTFTPSTEPRPQTALPPSTPSSMEDMPSSGQTATEVSPPQGQTPPLPQPATAAVPRPQVSQEILAPPTEQERPEANEVSHTPGWELGQNRHHIEVVNLRLEQTRRNMIRLQEENNVASITRQQAVIDRLEARLESLQGSTEELRSEAEASGTESDEEEGYESGAAERERLLANTIQESR